MYNHFVSDLSLNMCYPTTKSMGSVYLQCMINIMKSIEMKYQMVNTKY